MINLSAMTYERGKMKKEICPTCLKEIKSSDTVSIDRKTWTTRHLRCVDLRPEQKRAFKELDKAAKNVN